MRASIFKSTLGLVLLSCSISLNATMFLCEKLWQHPLDDTISQLYFQQQWLTILYPLTPQGIPYNTATISPQNIQLTSQPKAHNSALKSYPYPPHHWLTLQDTLGLLRLQCTSHPNIGAAISIPPHLTSDMIGQIMLWGTPALGAIVLQQPDSNKLLLWPLVHDNLIDTLPQIIYYAAQQNTVTFLQPESEQTLWMMQKGAHPQYLSLDSLGQITQHTLNAQLPNTDMLRIVTAALAGQRYFVTLHPNGWIKLYRAQMPQGALTELNQFQLQETPYTQQIPPMAIRSIHDELYLLTASYDTLLQLHKIYLKPTCNYPYTDSLIHAIEFETTEGFLSDNNYKTNTPYHSGNSPYIWQLQRCGAVSFQTIDGAQSLHFLAPSPTAIPLPMATQCYDTHQVDLITFTAFAYPGGTTVQLHLESSTNGGISYTQDSTYTLTTSHASYQYPLPQQADSLRLRLTLIPQGTATGSRIVQLDKLYYWTRIPDKSLTPPLVQPSTAPPYYTPTTITMSHPNPDAHIYYTITTDTLTLFTATRYTEPFTIDCTTSLQTMAYAPGYNTSTIHATQYLYPHIDTLYSLAQALAQPPANAYNHYRLEFNMPVVFANENTIYISNETQAMRLFGNIPQTIIPGQVITSVIATLQTSLHDTYYNPKWIGPSYSDTPVKPAIMQLDTITFHHMNHYISLRNVTLPQTITLSSSLPDQGACLITDPSGGSIMLRNYLAQIDQTIYNLFTYNIEGIIGNYGAQLHLYPLAITTQSAITPPTQIPFQWSLSHGMLTFSATIPQQMRILTLQGKELAHIIPESNTIDLSAYSQYQLLIIIADNYAFKISF